MSRARKGDAAVVEEDWALAAEAGSAGNDAGARPPTPPVVPRPEPEDPAPGLRAQLEQLRIEVADRDRVLEQLQAQRNAAMDEIALLKAQLKVAVEDGQRGWAAARAAGGTTH